MTGRANLNGVDLRMYSPGPADARIRHRYGVRAYRPLILSAGRLSPEKLVCHGRNGFLAGPGRSGELAGYLGLVISDPGLRARMSAASLRLIAGHERHRRLAEWESLYQMLASTGTAEP